MFPYLDFWIIRIYFNVGSLATLIRILELNIIYSIGLILALFLDKKSYTGLAYKLLTCIINS